MKVTERGDKAKIHNIMTIFFTPKLVKHGLTSTCQWDRISQTRTLLEVKEYKVNENITLSKIVKS